MAHFHTPGCGTTIKKADIQEHSVCFAFFVKIDIRITIAGDSNAAGRI
ncbi:MAG: hypothetical protein ACFFCZ_25730 [Promethearchaeota archaeon]